MDKKLIRINYFVGNTLYVKCFAIKASQYEGLDDPVDYFTALLAERRSVANNDIIIRLFMVCNSDDKIESILELNE